MNLALPSRFARNSIIMADTTGKAGYVPYVDSLQQMVVDAQLTAGAAWKGVRQPVRINAALAPVLLFSPHPDDESITGLLPLRLFEEEGRRVINVALTLGSSEARRDERARELADACGILGFEAEHFKPGCDAPQLLKLCGKKGGSAITGLVDPILRILERHRPALVIYPHGRDKHPAHEGAAKLLGQALRLYSGRGNRVAAVETECWQSQARVNLAVEGSVLQVGRLCQAISCHRGEVSRNPYHVRQPIRMLENGFRASETLGGFGSLALPIVFCELYNLFRYQNGMKRRSKQQRFCPQAARLSLDRLLADSLLPHTEHEAECFFDSRDLR